MFTREEISDGIMRINAMIEQRGLGLSPSQQNALRQDGASLNVRIADFEAGTGSWNAVSDAFTTFSKSAELVFGDEPVGATPVPAPAAPQPTPATPTSPPSGTRKWAPSQATPPVSPTPAPSPAPASDDSKVPTWLGPFVASRIVPIEDEVNSLGKRTAALEADMKQMRRTRKGSDFNFKVAGIAAAIVFTAIVIVLVIMAQSSGYAFSIAGGISIVIGCIAGALSAGSKSSKKATDTSAA